MILKRHLFSYYILRSESITDSLYAHAVLKYAHVFTFATWFVKELFVLQTAIFHSISSMIQYVIPHRQRRPLHLNQG